jgi:hypothetical protein
MTNDDFLAGLRADWRRQPIDIGGLAARVERRRRRARLALLWHLVSLIAFLAFAVVFAIGFVRTGEALFGLAALAFAMAAPGGLFEILDARRTARVRYDDTPGGVLRQARDQAEAARVQLRGCRWAALLLAGAGLAAIALAWAGWAEADTALLIAVAWMGAAAVAWLWQLWRNRRLNREIARCAALLSELEATAT